MNGTPRLRSAFSPPSGSGQKPKRENATASGTWSPRAPLPNPTIPINNGSEPAIPISVIDAPTQRLYVTFFYLGLTVWRLADYFGLVTDETDSLWLFMKWVAIDSVFLYGLPALKIPWLKWSSSTITTIFVVHAMLNAVLMFRIPVCISSPIIPWRPTDPCIDPSRIMAAGCGQTCLRPGVGYLGDTCQARVNPT